MRKAAFYMSFRRETLSALAAGFVERIGSSRQSLLPDGFARHITEVSCWWDYTARKGLLQLLHGLGVAQRGGGILRIQSERLLVKRCGGFVVGARHGVVARGGEVAGFGLRREPLFTAQICISKTRRTRAAGAMSDGAHADLGIYLDVIHHLANSGHSLGRFYRLFQFCG